MITLTKEWLMKTIAELEEERDATPGAVNEDAANALAAMKLALASLEAEPAHMFGIGSVFKPQILSVDEVDCDNCAHYQPNVCHGVGCPAAMLQGAEQQNRQQNIPENIPTLRDGLEAIRSLGEIDAGKIQAERDSINSPVIPDGWVMVPVEPTIAILDEFDSIIDYGAEDSKDAWSRLLAAAWIKSLPAAPQREVK
ncbi:TPA: hypothetical protein ACK1JP_000614 [Enterobacter hormaechei]|uniref:hypothetical protein n=1 Tax=Enterobacter hormaechei TaxID=158836 RepID=UPI001D031889|nr:hypothetical protein [Enterobacter hormaechei]